MNIQEAREKDIEEVKDMWLELAQLMEPYSKLNELNDDVEEEALEGIQKLFADDRYTIFIGKKNTQTTGFMVIKKDKQDARKIKNYIKISDLFIKENYRNQGYGAEFLEKAEEQAESQNCTHLKVSSEWKNNRARKFYKQNGYEEKQVEYSKTIQ